MKQPKLRRLTKKEREEIDKIVGKDFDFEAAMKKGIFINLDEEIIEYFKELAKETGKGYQSLIRDALFYFKEKKMKPKTIWKEEVS